jgi:hypothetical protein
MSVQTVQKELDNVTADFQSQFEDFDCQRLYSLASPTLERGGSDDDI